ncbi:MAG: hypothetical protein QOJ02_2040 [Acidobacteriota bacterium]|jgi:hypothetical protein|nr:hypothetical protein [Acidobacteriota bacterium]
MLKSKLKLELRTRSFKLTHCYNIFRLYLIPSTD